LWPLEIIRGHFRNTFAQKHFHLGGKYYTMHLHLSKPALRVLGLAESFVRPSLKSKLAGVVMRSDMRIDGVAISEVTVGGEDGTDGVLEVFRRLERKDINAIILSGAVISWFNIINIQEVYARLEIPMVCLTYQESPGLEGYIREYFPGDEERLKSYLRLGKREPVRLKTGYDVYVRALGLDPSEARLLLNKFTLDGRVPEPVRAAGLVARAMLRQDV
jgi:uncharacterized protein